MWTALSMPDSGSARLCKPRLHLLPSSTLCSSHNPVRNVCHYYREWCSVLQTHSCRTCPVCPSPNGKISSPPSPPLKLLANSPALETLPALYSVLFMPASTEDEHLAPHPSTPAQPCLVLHTVDSGLYPTLSPFTFSLCVCNSDRNTCLRNAR